MHHVRWRRHRRALALFGCVASLLMAASATATPGYRVAPPPAWVSPIAVAPGADPVAASSGAWFQLVDLQVRLGPGGGEQWYAHYAVQVLNSSGLEQAADLGIGFDPSHEQLTLHALRLHRDGAVIDKLADIEIRLLQRETDLEQRIFDGRVTASVVLGDLRVGDTLEYSYTVDGANPVFGGIPGGAARLGWSEPVGRVHARLLAAEDTPLQVVVTGTAGAPSRRSVGGFTEYLWDQRDVPSLATEDGAPAWYDPYPTLRWSGFADWSAVAEWAEPLYDTTAHGDAVAAQVRRIAAQHDQAPARLLAALRFVQEEIRYLGIEVGAASHAPHAPQLVLARRFGDCKDKALLLLSLLHGLGIEAHAALVHDQGIPPGLEGLPTARRFNHVMVMARVAGQLLWLDPTLPPQAGTLDTLHQPDHGQALLVRAERPQLVPMDSELRSVATRTVEVLLDASDGFGDARYTVTTTLTGRLADAARADRASSSSADIQERYQRFYASYYPGIERTADLAVEDDPEANWLRTIEQYRIPDAWHRAEDAARVELDIAAHDLRDLLPPAVSPQRSWPLALPHPLDITQVTEVRLAEAWPVDASPFVVQDPAFRFERSTAVEGATIVFTDRFRTLAGHVAADDVPAYQASLDRVRLQVGDVLHLNDSSDHAWWARTNWTVVLAGAFFLLLWLLLARRAWAWDPPGDVVTDTALAGIRGWLILPAIGAALAPLLIALQLAGLVVLLELETWTALTVPGQSAYHPLWLPLLLLELAGSLGLMVGWTYFALLFFRRRRSVPAAYVLLTWASIGYGALDQSLVSLMPGTSGTDSGAAELVRATVWGMVWSAYFLRARRVAATFTRRHRQPAATPAGTATAATMAATPQPYAEPA